jgi:CDP-glucose 4,6-dehydratase
MGCGQGPLEGLDIMTQFTGIYNNLNVFITGITGFKGSWLALWLTKLGANVTGYALKPPTNPNHFDLIDLDIPVIYGDIRNEEDLTKAVIFSKPEIVFHLAAQPLVRYSYSNPKETFETNVIGTLNLFEACRKAEYTRAIVNITSDKCYENREWIWPYRENEAMGGGDPYSASKGCVELLTACYRKSFFNLNNYGSDHNVLIASCRAGNVIGGGDWAEDRLVPDVIKAAVQGIPVTLRNPGAIRPWQHVLEPLSGYLLLGQKLLQKETVFADAWNFGPDERDYREVEDVVELCNKNWGVIHYQKDANTPNLHEASILKLDSSKARKILGWYPVWDITMAIIKSTDWYRNYYENKKIISTLQINDYIEDAIINNISWVIR